MPTAVAPFCLDQCQSGLGLRVLVYTKQPSLSSNDPVDGRLGAFCGILLLSGLTQWLEPAFNLPLLYASFGASAVLVFGVISSPLAQPRNFLGAFSPPRQIQHCL